MSEFFNNAWTNCTNWISNITNDAVGNGLIYAGTHTQEVAGVVIALGVLLLICRHTKVLRWGCISYMLGLLIELIGSVIIK